MQEIYHNKKMSAGGSSGRLWAHVSNPALGPNKNAFSTLFEAKYKHFLFFRASSYHRSIKQFILQSTTLCETPLDYFSMLWSSSVDMPTNFFIQRFSAALHHNSTGQQQLNYLAWLPGTVSNFHKVRAAALQNRSDLRLLASLRRFESARLGGGNSLPLVFRDLNVLPDPTYLFFLSRRSTFNEVKNLRVPLASLQDTLSGFDPLIFGRVRPVLQLPFSPYYNKYLRFAHLSLFRDSSLRSWKAVWLRHQALLNFLSFKQTVSHLRRYFLSARTRPLTRFGFHIRIPRSFYNSRWLGLPSPRMPTSLIGNRAFRIKKSFSQSSSRKKKHKDFFLSRFHYASFSRFWFFFFRHFLHRGYADSRFPSFFFSTRWFLHPLKIRWADLRGLKTNKLNFRSRFFLPSFFTTGPRFVGFSESTRGYRFSRPWWTSRRRVSLFRMRRSLRVKHSKKRSFLFRSLTFGWKIRSRFLNYGTSADTKLAKKSAISPLACYTSNKFFRLPLIRLLRFSRSRRSRRFYRKRWSLFSRFHSKVYRASVRKTAFLNRPSSVAGCFPIRFFFHSSRFALIQFLRVSSSHKLRVLKLLKRFSIEREHPALRLGSRRHFSRFVANHANFLFPYLTTGCTSLLNANSTFASIPSDRASLLHIKQFTAPSLTRLVDVNFVKYLRFCWFNRLLFLKTVPSGSSFTVNLLPFYDTSKPLFLSSDECGPWGTHWPWFSSSSWDLPISLVPSFPPLPPNYYIQPRRPLVVNSRFSLRQLRRARVSYYAYFRMVRNMKRIRNPGVNFFHLYRFSNSFVSRRFIVSLSRFFFKRRSLPLFWAGFFFPTYFRPFLRSRFERHYALSKKVPFIRRKRLLTRWRRCRSFLRRHRWKSITHQIFPSTFYRTVFKLISCPTADGGTRVFLRHRASRQRYRARVFFRARLHRAVNFVRHQSYSFFYTRYLSFQKLSVRRYYRRFFFGTRFFFQPSLDLRFFSDNALPLRRWWLKRVKGRFYPRLYKRRNKGFFSSRNRFHRLPRSRFRRRCSKKKRRFLRRYRSFRFSGFMFPKVFFILNRFKRPISNLKFRFFRSLLRSSRTLTRRFFFCNGNLKRSVLKRFFLFLKKRRRRLLRRRLRLRRHRFERVFRRFSPFFFFGSARKRKKRQIWYRRRSRFLFLQLGPKTKLRKSDTLLSSPLPPPVLKKKNKYVSVRIPAALRLQQSKVSRAFSSDTRSGLINNGLLFFIKPSSQLPRFSRSNHRLFRVMTVVPQSRKQRRVYTHPHVFFRFSFAPTLRIFSFSGFCFLARIRRLYSKPRRRIPSRFFLSPAIPYRRRGELASVLSWRKLRAYDRWFFRRRFCHSLKNTSATSFLRLHRLRCWRRFQCSYKLIPWSLAPGFRNR